MSEALPEGLARIEAQAGRTQQAAAALVPLVENAEAAAQRTAARLEEADNAVAYQREALDALLTRIAGGSGDAEDQLRRLAASAAEAQETTRDMVERLGDGSGRAAGLAERAEQMARSFAAIAAQLDEQLPGGLAAGRKPGGADAAGGGGAGAARSPASKARPKRRRRSSADREAAIARQREALDALLARIAEGGADAETQLQALAAAAVEAQQAVGADRRRNRAGL